MFARTADVCLPWASRQIKVESGCWFTRNLLPTSSLNAAQWSGVRPSASLSIGSAALHGSL